MNHDTTKSDRTFRPGTWALLFAFVLVAWSMIQLPLFDELEEPWERPGAYNLGLKARQMAMIGCEALLITAALYCTGRRTRRVLATGLGLLCLLTTANLAYFEYFGNIIHLRKLRELYTLFYIRDQLLVQILGAWSYVQLAAGLALVATLWKAAGHPRWPAPPGLRTRLLVLVPAIALFYTLYSMQASRFWQKATPARHLLGNSTAYYMFGMFPVYGSMTLEMIRPDRASGPVPPIGTSLNAGQSRQPVPALDPDAVFFIQAESLDASAVFLASSTGSPLMPFLRGLAGQSVLLRSFYHHHNGAASASAEIGALLGIVPDAEHNGLLSLRRENCHPLNLALEAHGYESFFLHSNRGSFLGRRDAYERMGFDHFIDMSDFRGEAAGFRARDDAFFRQSLEILQARCPPGRRPFAYFVTMQTHGPFKNYRPETADDLRNEGFTQAGPSADPLLRDYLCSMRELDLALSQFWASATNGPYRRPLVFLYPDHLSGVLDQPSGDQEIGLAMIWSPDLPPSTIDAPISSYDFPPTVMHLLGGNDWPQSDWWIGDTVFTAGPRRIIQIHNIILEGEGRDIRRRRAATQEQKFIFFSRDIQN